MDTKNIVIKRAADLQAKAKQIGRAVYTNFLDPSEQMALISIKTEKGVELSMWGGYEVAERKLAAFYPSGEEPQSEKYPLVAVLLSLSEGHGLIHRDFLGSLMALGIKREQIGDIFLQPCGAVIFCGETIVKYVEQNLLKVGNINVTLSIVSANSIEPPKRELKEVKGTVASARLDAVLSLATKKSRGQSASEIEGGLVNVNYKQVMDSSHKLKPGDIVSCRGFGRFEYVGDSGVTKKGRLAITIRIYI